MLSHTGTGACYHCGQPLPRGVDIKVDIDGASQPMCCRGCQAVAEAIVAGGLTDYYRYRTDAVPTARELVPAFLRQTAVYDNPAVQKTFVQNVDGNSREASLILEGMVCAACVWLNEQHLAKLPGVLSVAVNYSTHRARVRWDESRIQLSRILQAVSEIGYLAHPYDPGRAQEILERERRVHLRRLAVAAAFGMQVMILAVALYAGAFTGIETEFKTLFQWLSLVLTLPVLGYSAQPFFRSALRDLRRKRAGMDVPVSLGLAIAFAGSLWATVSGHGEVYYDSVAMFVFFLLSGRYFELTGRKRAAEVSETLVHMLPVTATRLIFDPLSPASGGEGIKPKPSPSATAPGVALPPASMQSSFPLPQADPHPLPYRMKPHSLGRGEVGENLYIDRGEPTTSPYKTEAVPASELNSGDLVLVRPGESIPADGHVHEGRSSVDESLLTGESLPLAKTPGAVLIGGSINIESPLTMRVDKTGAETVLSAILRLLDRAQTEKPAIAAAADRAAAWFVARVLLLAAGVALFWFLYDPARWLPITLAVLVVTCPCALSLATPTAITAATGRLMRRGLVTTRGHALETLARANTFVFDKTGTLTYGRLTLLDTHAYTRLGASECLSLATALEQHSEHPIARALRATVDELRRTATDVVSTPGAGLSGTINGERYFLGTAAFLREAADIPVRDDTFAALRAGGNTLVLLSDSRQLLAAFVIGDEVRAGARTLVTELQRQGKRVLLLTGDHPGAAGRVARETGIREVEADLRPQDKLARIHTLASQGAIVAMVGDGVNDAAALAAAHVSVAMGGGTQIAAAAADMILLSEQLPHLAEAVRVASKTLRIIRQNLAWAVGYNLVALPFAAAGWVAPWMAALGMSASSLIVVANALRLGERTARAAPYAVARA